MRLSSGGLLAPTWQSTHSDSQHGTPLVLNLLHCRQDDLTMSLRKTSAVHITQMNSRFIGSHCSGPFNNNSCSN